jgi:hypothetical protein
MRACMGRADDGRKQNGHAIAHGCHEQKAQIAYRKVRMKKIFTAISLPGLLFTAFPVSAQVAAPIVPAAGDPLYAPVATSDDPETIAEKFMDYSVLNFGPRAIFAPVFAAALRMADPPSAYPHAWRDGPGAFGRDYGDAIAVRSSMDTGRFLAGAALREDFRYRPSGSKNPLVRTFHALAFTVIDRSDSGQPRIAIANFVGAGAGGFIGELYLPPGFNNLSHAETRMAISFGGLAAQNVLREFEPDLEKLARKLHLPAPRFPVPAWWVKLDQQ